MKDKAHTINFRPGKPNQTGDYLFFPPGQAHPVFARVRIYDNALNVLYETTRLPLDELPDNTQFSNPINLEFAGA